MKKPIAVLAADIHAREDQPECRMDNFLEAFRRKWQFVGGLLEDMGNIPMIIAGDVFHRWKASPWLISECIQLFPRNLYSIAGNHDLPHHSWNQLSKSAIWTLHRAEALELLGLGTNPDIIPFDGINCLNVCGFHYGARSYENPWLPRRDFGLGLNVAVIHRLVTESKDDVWRNTSATEAKKLFNDVQGFDLILTGDNHKSFTCKIGDVLLVNPGSFTRQTAAQMEHEPAVYIWYDNNTAEKVVLPHDKKAVSREHLKKQEQRNERMEAFVNKLKLNEEAGLSYTKNLESYFESNKETTAVEDMVWQSVENV